MYPTANYCDAISMFLPSCIFKRRSKGGCLNNSNTSFFWLCNMKLLNFTHLTLAVKNSLKLSIFSRKKQKRVAKRPILFCLVSRSFRLFYNNLFQISEDYRRFRKTVECFRRLTKRSDHCRRCPKNPPKTSQYFLRKQ